jgi:predicted lipoprotein with Yx(FWY)xxD motif
MTSIPAILSRRAGLAALVATTLALGACATLMPPAAPAQVADGRLTTATGMTLYTFDRDTAGRSACNGPCAQNWPPLAAAADARAAADYSVVVRDDGSRQWAYKGRPLYTWVRDAKPGDTTGDGFNGVWHVARP